MNTTDTYTPFIADSLGGTAAAVDGDAPPSQRVTLAEARRLTAAMLAAQQAMSEAIANGVTSTEIERLLADWLRAYDARDTALFGQRGEKRPRALAPGEVPVVEGDTFSRDIRREGAVIVEVTRGLPGEMDAREWAESVGFAVPATGEASQ